MNKERLINTLQVQSESYKQFRMFAYIIRQLSDIGCDYYVHNGNIYATKHTNEVQSYYPCMVAHMDTVHDIQSDFHVMEFNDRLTAFNRRTMRQTGIGGDDKVGIYIALEALRKFDNIKAAFFRDEEVGCEGSYSPHHSFFGDCGFIIQCDRKGNTDFITEASGITLAGKAFKKAVKSIIYKYGYDFERGLMTDVMALKENYIDAAMCNISCGYYNPHCDYEYVSINDVAWCQNMVFEIIEALNDKPYRCYYQRNLKSYGKSLYNADKGKNKPTSPFNADSRNFTTEHHVSKIKPLKMDMPFDYWENEFSKLRKKFDGDDHAHDTYCDSCREHTLTTYIPEFRMNVCDTCLLSLDNYNSYQTDSDRVNLDS